MSRLLFSIIFTSLLSACGSNSVNPDLDGDGVINERDAFPRDASESADSDGDGVGNNADAFPYDKNETLDSDGDGVGDHADVFPLDFDNDGTPDLTDMFPQDPGESIDSDGDGVGDNADVFPHDENETLDSDGDGVGDHADVYPLDFDNDGTPDLTDMFPQDPDEWIDSDGDGVGDNADAFPNDKDQTTDANCDGYGDNSDVDAIPDGMLGGGIGLGDGVGSAYHAGVAITGLDEGEVLSANGTTTVTVHVVAESCDNLALLSPQSISFTSVCTQVGLAEFTPEMVTVAGVATAIYHDKGCGKLDNILVSLRAKNDDGIIIEVTVANATIEVMPVRVAAIQFVQVMPSTIALKGFANESTPEFSSVEFQVLDIHGNPSTERNVYFELNLEYGGTTLSANSAVTDQEGKVSVTLSAGNVAGTVRVKASIDVNNDNHISTISTLSDPISMAGTLGNQGNFTLSSSQLNPWAWDVTGTEVDITASLSTYNQNPVLDGTTIYFTTSGGLIDPSCETIGGVCSVKWISANPKPVDGYVTILAHAQGQGDYQDANRNGLYDLGESFSTYGESWLDANGNGRYDESGSYQPDLDVDNDGENEFSWDIEGFFFEYFIDSNSNGEFDLIPGLKYQGINCSDAAKTQGHCLELVEVSQSLRLQMSAGNDVYIEGPFVMNETGEYEFSEKVTCLDGRSESHKVAWRIADSEERRNHLSAGATINYTDSNLVVADEQGFGEVQSTAPVDVLPVWEIKQENATLTAEQRKYKYLNERAHLVEMTVSKPENVDPELTHGLLTINVGSMEGVIYLGWSQQLSLGYSPDYCAPPVLELEL